MLAFRSYGAWAAEIVIGGLEDALKQLRSNIDDPTWRAQRAEEAANLLS